jgi:hypothetical protein
MRWHSHIARDRIVRYFVLQSVCGMVIAEQLGIITHFLALTP